jgi:hypothetical protein
MDSFNVSLRTVIGNLIVENLMLTAQRDQARAESELLKIKIADPEAKLTPPVPQD